MSAEARLKEKLLKEAREARRRAHAPYSGYKIGAALVDADGRIFSGCNVENASYGGTVCAERVAIFKAVSEGARKPFREVCVVSDAKEPWPPCGFCRQVLAEFVGPQAIIHLANTRRIVRSVVFKDLFPEGFGPAHLR